MMIEATVVRGSHERGGGGMNQCPVVLGLSLCEQVIVDFRQWRERRGKKGPPSDPKEFVRTDKHEKGPQPQ